MAFNLSQRHLLSLMRHTPEEIHYLLDLSSELKRARRAGTEQPRLQGKHIALIFEKTSTRTRCAFEVAAKDQGACVTYIDGSSSQMGHKESIRDTARVLGRMFDAIEFRGTEQATLETLAAHAGVPVFNGLTAEFHPTQMLADMLTMVEHSTKPLHDIRYVFLGDARFNMGRSLLMVGAKLGMDVRIGAPKALWPDGHFIEICRAFARDSGAHISLTEDAHEAVKGVDFVHTDIWVSMGEPDSVWDQRIAVLRPYRVDAALMAMSGNPRVKFMHCLPAYHGKGTLVERRVAERYPEFTAGIEVTNDVFESPASVVFDQAENRLHTIKAVMVSSLG